MATDIIKVEGKYRVFEQGGKGKPYGTHDTRHEAEAQMRAIEHGTNARKAKPSPGTQAGDGLRLNDSYEKVPITDVYVDGKKIATE